MTRRKWFILVAFVAFLAVDVVLLVWWFTRPTYTEPPLSFDGSSDQLQHTVIVPTLDTPIPEGKNAIWCASFQIAWNKLKSDVTKGPVLIQGAEGIAERLNKSPVTEADLPEGSYYAAAGLVKDGIVEKIQREMKAQFSRVPAPRFDSHPELALIAYGYLESSLKYTIPFFDVEEPLKFKDAGGKESEIRSFGIRPGDLNKYHKLRKQVAVLFSEYSGSGPKRTPTFAVDPCRDSSPFQIVLAVIERQNTLASVLQSLEERREAAEKKGPLREFAGGASLLIPTLHWRLDHRFSELEGISRRVRVPGESETLFVTRAGQAIQFKLDRAGAALRSEFKLEFAKSEMSLFYFNRPFLIVLKKRGAAHPFFVMWVDNAELLQKWGE